MTRKPDNPFKDVEDAQRGAWASGWSDAKAGRPNAPPDGAGEAYAAAYRLGWLNHERATDGA